MQVDVLRLIANLLACPDARDEEEFRECLNHVRLDWICQHLPALDLHITGQLTPEERQAVLQVLVNVAVFGEHLLKNSQILREANLRGIKMSFCSR